jgi:hypothetical protein
MHRFLFYPSLKVAQRRQKEYFEILVYMIYAVPSIDKQTHKEMKSINQSCLVSLKLI